MFTRLIYYWGQMSNNFIRIVLLTMANNKQMWTIVIRKSK